MNQVVTPQLFKDCGGQWKDVQVRNTLMIYWLVRYCCCLVTQSFLTVCGPLACSQLGSSANGILHARILEWGAISYSRGSSQPRAWKPHVSCIPYIGRQILYHYHHLGNPKRDI